MQQLQKSFPDTVQLKNRGKLLEFCPDETCDGFVTSGNVAISTLKDFAYLYVFLFSDNVVLDGWRHSLDATKTADEVLARHRYVGCAKTGRTERARWVLRYLSRGGQIKLVFVRYDDGERVAVPKNLSEELTKTPSN